LSAYPEDLRYTKEHEWVRVEKGTATVGISDYAQSELGDIIYVELPPVGEALEAGKAMGTVEAVKTVEEIYSPLDGEIVEINEGLEAAPEKVNQDAYGEGWMVKLKIADSSQLESLMDSSAYRELIGE